MTRERKSLVWNYFVVDNTSEKKAICNCCRKLLSYRSTITNLKLHLKQNHKSVYEELRKEECDQSSGSIGTSAMKNHIKFKHTDQFQALNDDVIITKLPIELPGTSSISGLAKQSPTQESHGSKVIWDTNYAKIMRCHYLIAEMIAIDNQPLSLVEKTGFTRLLEEVVPHYKMPSRAYISEIIVPDIYDKIFEKIKRNISNSLTISVTLDIWSCLDNDVKFMSFTAHWVTPEFKLKYAVLEIKPFLDLHIEENITRELQIIENRWDINLSKIHLLVHNSDANVLKSNGVAKLDSIRCFIHSLQNAINESLKSEIEVITMISASRQLVTYFNNSNLAQEKLQGIQRELNLPQHQLVKDISTRWNSTFYMIQRILEQKRAISLLAAGNNTFPNLSYRQWNLVEQCIRLLQPFAEITKIITSGLSCISEVIPYIAALKKYLHKYETEQVTPDLLLMRASLKSEVETHFNCLIKDYNYLIATFLDPRFKTDFLGTVEAERARQEIHLRFVKMFCDDSSVLGPSLTKRIKQETDLEGPKDVNDTFWACFNEVANDSYTQSHDRERNAITCEISFFLKQVRIDRNSDPYIWWSANSLQYPNLSKFARMYLSAPCSSVFRERLFSEAGLIYEDKRNYLMSLNAEKLLFIHHNLPLVEYEY